MKWLIVVLVLTACGVNGTPEPKGDTGIPPVWSE
jgi:hypothetical protein